MKVSPFVIIVVIALLLVVVKGNKPSALLSEQVNGSSPPLRYIAVGDSYSVGTGASPGEAWPSLLAGHLSREGGIPTVLVANPSQPGFTTADALEKELPQLPERADLATLMIGANDWVKGVSPGEFRGNLRLLIQDLQGRVPPGRLFLITIPDFSRSPVGGLFAVNRNVTAGIAQFNGIIEQEAAAFQLEVVEVPELPWTAYSLDGIHPNQEGYRIWEGAVFQAIRPEIG